LIIRELLVARDDLDQDRQKPMLFPQLQCGIKTSAANGGAIENVATTLDQADPFAFSYDHPKKGAH
jgi:hypothetical protein